MSKTHPVISVGIDVSKAKLDVAYLYDDQSSTARSFANTVTGIDEFISSLKTQRTAKAVPCVIESTGDYHLLSTLMVDQVGFTVKVINPLITKKYQKASIRQAKSDRVDAKRLAQIGLFEPSLPVFSAQKDEIMAKKMISLLAQLEKVKQRLKASYKQFVKTQKQLELPVVDLGGIEDTLTILDRTMKSIKDTLVGIAPSQSEEIANLLPGVSSAQVAILLCSLSSKTFNHRDQLVAFVGLDVRARRSGTWQGREKLSKRGNSYLRKVLYQIAWGLSMHHPEYQEYYQRLYKEEGKHYTTTLIAIARKFLRFLHAYYWQGKINPQPAA